MSRTGSAAARLQSPAQLRYARLLDWGARLGLLLLLVGFPLYLLDVLPAQVPLQHLPKLWGQPAASYLEQSATPGGWGWLALLHKGDLFNLLGVALLAGCSLPPLLAVALLYLRQRDWPMAVIAVATVAVIVLAASGWLTMGP